MLAANHSLDEQGWLIEQCKTYVQHCFMPRQMSGVTCCRWGLAPFVFQADHRKIGKKMPVQFSPCASSHAPGTHHFSAR